MNFLSGLLILFFTSFAVVRGTSMLVSGKMRRRFAKGYEMLNEGILVRVLGLILILLGVVILLTGLGILSETMVIGLWFLLFYPEVSLVLFCSRMVY